MRVATKTESLNLRVEPQIKEILRYIASKEHRTLANMVEYLIVDYFERTDASADKDQLFLPLDNSAINNG